MRAAPFIALTLVALLCGACEDHHTPVESPVQAVQNLHPLQTRPDAKTKAFDEALDGDGSSVVRSIEDCEETDDAATCAAQAAEARAEHLRKAPRFVDQQTCEAFYGAGRCEEVPPAPPDAAKTAVSNAKRFVPVMQGYVVGRAITKPVPIYFGRPTLCTQTPQASGCKGSPRGTSPGRALVPTGHAQVAPRAASPAPRPTAVSPAPKIKPRTKSASR
jgi:uncharacterized protein YgiB involved in biofilm formation